MKQHHIEKLRQLHRGRDFYSEKHKNDCYYSLSPISDNIYELHRNSEYQPDIIVRFTHNKIVSIGQGVRSGYNSAIDLDHLQFLDLNFIDSDNFSGDDDDINFIASFDGEEVDLVGGGQIPSHSFYNEFSLF